jgi:hypothetical protein
MIRVRHRDEGSRRARRRVAAVGASATVTILSVGGVFGLVPGAQGTTLADEAGLPQTAAPTPADLALGASDAGGQTGSSTPAEAAGEATVSSPLAAPVTSGPGQVSSAPVFAFPIPPGTGSGKRIVFDLSEQRVWLVDAHNRIERTYLGSGSKYGNLHAGRFEVYSRSRNAVSYDYSETMQYMVRFDHGDSSPIGFHAIPVDSEGRPVQTNRQLGTPLSAGCIRQADADARALWRFAPIGTDVWIVA